MTRPLKIFVSRENDQPLGMLFRYTLPWQIDNIKQERWQFVDQAQDADVWVFLFYFDDEQDTQRQLAWARKHYTGQIIMIMKLWIIYEHASEYKHQRLIELWQTVSDRVVIIDKNLNNRHDISYDFMLNRNLVYYRDYHKLTRPSELVWSERASERMYQLTPIDKRHNKVFLFTARTVNRSHGSREQQRLALAEHLSVWRNLGHWGTTQDPLPPQEQPDRWRERMQDHSFSFWWPVHDLYYNTSWVSIYVETLTEDSEQFCVTEKTWDPLIKGNFILPMATSGFVKYLKNLGLEFPTNIDYSYDQEPDRTRFQRYLESVTRAVQEPINNYKQQQAILEHNRSTILSWSYDSLWDKFIKYAETHGWKI